MKEVYKGMLMFVPEVRRKLSQPGTAARDPNRSLRLVRVCVREGWREDGALRLCGLQLTASVVKAS